MYSNCLIEAVKAKIKDPEEGLIDFPEKNKICKYVLVSDEANQIRSVKIEDLKKKYMDWKYLSPYDDCWKILGDK